MRLTAYGPSVHLLRCSAFQLLCRFSDAGTHDALRRPASEKRQGTKSRGGNVGGAANSTYGDLTGIGSEREYNFLELARSLLIGESNFRIACDFKELDVAKIAQISTSALSA